ncbi:Bacterial Ig-like domain (group 2) [compost metagenome]
MAIILNAMPEEGWPDPGYITTDTLLATVQASDGTSRRVKWESSDPSRVTVENGVVRTTRGAEEGEVTITATSADDPTKFATTTITVTIDSDLIVGVN